VQDILGNAFEEKQGTWKWQWKRRVGDKQWTDSAESRPYVPLIHRFTGDGMVFWPHTTPQERQPLLPAVWKCKIVITGFKKANEYSVVCVQKKKNKPG